MLNKNASRITKKKLSKKWERAILQGILMKLLKGKEL